MSRSVLITGGTGTFGHALVRELLAHRAGSGFYFDRVIVYSRDEFKQFNMRAEVEDPDLRLRFFLGDVRDRLRLSAAMRRVDLVVHAAALKHVPLLEYNPQEAVKTNVLGAMNVIEAAIANGVERVVALSTDKACAPFNLYGATKLTAEKLFVASNALSDSTRFSCVRYGNVSGSRGSVIPTWRERAERGDVLPVTDRAMTRFWMTIEQAVQLVLTSVLYMHGGEVFLPELKAYTVGALADVFRQHYGVEQQLIGSRPGEKLHESLISEDERVMAYRWRHGYALIPEETDDLCVNMPPAASVLEDVVTSEHAKRLTHDELRALLQQLGALS